MMHLHHFWMGLSVPKNPVHPENLRRTRIGLPVMSENSNDLRANGLVGEVSSLAAFVSAANAPHIMYEHDRRVAERKQLRFERVLSEMSIALPVNELASA